MIYSWPPIMHVHSEDLKRCLGNVDMTAKTMWKHLRELGYNTNGLKYVVTEDLIERVQKMSGGEVMINFDKYQARNEKSKELLKA